MTAERHNAFAGLKEGERNLGDEFKPKAPTEKRAPTIDLQAIDKLSEEQGFPSRKAVKPEKRAKAPARERQRRNATGRNQQINIKTTAEAIALLYELADRKRVPLGKVLEDGLEALKREGY